MAPNTVTRGEKPKRKIVISTIEMSVLLYIIYINIYVILLYNIFMYVLL
jgi:hypothetical protein